MTRADFPTITGPLAGRYIATARLTPNAVALRIARLMGRGVMLRKCSWCGASLGTRICAPEMHGQTTHGICDTCAEINFPSDGPHHAASSNNENNGFGNGAIGRELTFTGDGASLGASKELLKASSPVSQSPAGDRGVCSSPSGDAKDSHEGRDMGLRSQQFNYAGGI